MKCHKSMHTYTVHTVSEQPDLAISVKKKKKKKKKGLVNCISSYWVIAFW